MEIKSVSLHELRKMNNSEGLILQGCGGDLQEWVDQQIEHDVSRANAGKLVAESAMRKESRGTSL